MAMTDEQEAAFKADLEKSNAATKAELDKLKADLAKYTAKPPPKEDDPDLADKARKEREAKDIETKRQSEMEKALQFNMAGPEWLKANASLLPNSVESIFAAAEKENYGSATEKATAIKVGIFSEFFALESNMSQLTGPQKIQVEEFKKLAKTERQERIGQIWDQIFEPTFETIKKVKRAAQVANGQKDQTDKEKALAQRMMAASRKHYLGDKNA